MKVLPINTETAPQRLLLTESTTSCTESQSRLSRKTSLGGSAMCRDRSGSGPVLPSAQRRHHGHLVAVLQAQLLVADGDVLSANGEHHAALQRHQPAETRRVAISASRRHLIAASELGYLGCFRSNRAHRSPLLIGVGTATSSSSLSPVSSALLAKYSTVT